MDPSRGQKADDVGSWAMSRWSEIGPSAIVHRYGPVSELESEPMPEIADVMATTDPGTMTLREMMDDPRSRLKAIAVIHEGKLVFEEYTGIRDWDNHIWASATKILVGTLVHLGNSPDHPVTLFYAITGGGSEPGTRHVHHERPPVRRKKVRAR